MSGEFLRRSNIGWPDRCKILIKHCFFLLLLGYVSQVLADSAQSSSSICSTVSNNLVSNCGFETGSTSSWTTTGTFGQYDGITSGTKNSGSHSLELGNITASSPAGVTQTLTTTAGSSYTFSFYIYQPGNSGSNQQSITVKWNSTTLLLTTSQVTSWTQYTYTVTGTGSDTISFSGFNIADYTYVDDVEVYGALSITTVTPATLVAQYHFEQSSWSSSGSVTDSSGNNYNGSPIGSSYPTSQSSNPAITGTNGTCGYAVMPGSDSNGGAFSFTGLPVTTISGGQTSVAFWMYWNGSYGTTNGQGVMPIGWLKSDLLISSSGFGFNTSQSDLYGISTNSWGWQNNNWYWWFNDWYWWHNNNTVQIANQWHHIVAVFDNNNITKNQLYIDGIAQSLNQLSGSASNTYNVVQSTLQVGGWTNTTGYRFAGNIDELQVFTGTLSASQVASVYHETHNCANGTTATTSFNAFDTSTAAGATGGFIQTKVAGTPFTLDVAAISTNSLSISTGFTGSVKVELVDGTTSSTCSNMTAIQTVASSYTFTSSDAGRHTFTGISQNQAYPQVGVRISYPATSSTSVVCAMDNFAIRPASFGVVATDSSWTSAGSGRTLNASTSTGTPTHKAGQPLTLVITPYNSLGTVAGDITTAYNGTPVATANCNLPSSCVLGTFNLGTLSLSNGVSTTTTASYSDVGIINLTVSDSTFAQVDAYDGTTSQQLTITSTTTPIGRFVPDHFDLTFNTPQFTPGCGTFTYIGQPITYATNPVATVTAANASDVVTQNYVPTTYIVPTSSSFGIAPAYTLAGYTLNVYSSTTNVQNSGSGVGTLTFAYTTASTPPPILYISRTNLPIAGFQAAIGMYFTMQDTDGVTVGYVNGAASSNPVYFGSAGSSSNIGFTNGNNMQYWGRLALSNANGSELLPLTLPLTAQYYNGSTFVTSANDNCTTPTLSMFSLSNPSTSNGATQLGSATMTVGTGNSAASLLNSPVVNGLGGLTFSSPGAGNTGYINVSSNFSSLPWLLYNWNQAGLGNTSPTAVATFGVYQGSNKVIYFKEMY